MTVAFPDQPAGKDGPTRSANNAMAALIKMHEWVMLIDETDASKSASYVIQDQSLWVKVDDVEYVIYDEATLDNAINRRRFDDGAKP